MIKPIGKLGDTYLEATVNIILLILLLPVMAAAFIIFSPVMVVDSLRSKLRHEPKPHVPEVLGDISDSKLPAEKLAKEYIHKIGQLVPDVTVTKQKDTFLLRSKAADRKAVEMYFDHSLLGIDIDGLQTGYWNTAEVEDLDFYFWVAVGFLRNGALVTRTIFGRKRYWIKLDELRVWVKMRPEGSISDSDGFYLAPPKNKTW